MENKLEKGCKAKLFQGTDEIALVTVTSVILNLAGVYKEVETEENTPGKKPFKAHFGYTPPAGFRRLRPDPFQPGVMTFNQMESIYQLVRAE